MPSGLDSLLGSLIIKKPIRAPVIKQSCGIGDSDGFPAFDINAETYAAPEDRVWGFQITGGANFHMPLTVFQVTPGSLAAREGICLGDIILYINDIDASQMTLAQAHEIINTEQKIFLVARGMEDEEVPEGERKPIEDKAICMRLPQPMKMPSPPKAPKVPLEEKLRAMQRKLSEIAEIPKLLSSTLQTVSRTFEQFLPPEDDINLTSKFDINDSDDKESGTQDDLCDDYDNDDDDDVLSEVDSLDDKIFNNKNNKEETPESDYVSDNDNFQDDNDVNGIPKLTTDESDIEANPIEPTEDDLLKKEKQEKIIKLEQSWPWADRQKIIYKQSTCHLVPKLSIVQSRIKQLGEKNVMAFYEKNRKESI